MKKRIWELDAFRGLCILGVVMVHLIYDLVELYGILDWQYPTWFAFIKEWGGILFLLLSGICATLGSHSVRRGLVVFACGMIITGVTYGMYRMDMADKGIIIYFRQRMKRMIITSGYNVYPGQLENIIDGHEKVLLSCVIGVKDQYRGQKIRAYVVPMPGVEPTEELKKELLDYCADKIAKYAMPRDIVFRTELPKTLVGKVAYRVLEEEAAQETAE